MTYSTYMKLDKKDREEYKYKFEHHTWFILQVITAGFMLISTTKPLLLWFGLMSLTFYLVPLVCESIWLGKKGYTQKLVKEVNK